MANGFSVDLSALEQASAGVNGTLDQVDQLAVSAISHSPAAFGHVTGKLDSYLRARQYMPGYEQAPLGLDFTQPGATPAFRAAVENAVSQWKAVNRARGSWTRVRGGP